MRYNLKNEIDRQEFKQYCNDLYKSEEFVEVRRIRPQRSLRQNAYLHVVLSYYASEFGYTLEEVKQDIFKKLVNPSIFKSTRKNKRGQDVTYLRSTRTLDSGELTTAIERFRNYSSMIAGLYIPSPNEEEALIEAQKQIAMYEEYI